MKTIKKPSNKNSLPSVIISKFDTEKIYELKIKYEKLARLDKLEIETMSFDTNNNVLFENVKFNGIDIEIKNSLKLEFDSYIIYAKKQVNDTNKTILTLQKNDKTITYSVHKRNANYYKKDGTQFLCEDGVKIINEREVNDKFIVTIEDKFREESDETATKRIKQTQRDIIKNKTLDIYKRISSYKSIQSQDMYTIKRYISFRSDMMFFYTFIDNFFTPLFPKEKKELWKIDFSQTTHLHNFISFTLNDTLKNPKGILEYYCKESKTIQNDFQKIKNIFEKIRHALAHFDFQFIDDLLSNKISFDFDIQLLNEIIKKTQELYFEVKKEFIEEEHISILDEKDISIKKLYTFYSKIEIKKPAFNKLINSFIIKEGIENASLKQYIKEKYGESYFINIHQNKEYKKIYNSHKKLVAKNQALQLDITSNGQKLKEINDTLQKLKIKMNTLTKQNSLKRLEYKLRLGFGFIASEYKNFKEFKNNFDEDIKKGDFKDIAIKTLQEYLDKSYSDSQFFHYKSFNKKTQKRDIEKDIFEDIQRESLQELVQNDTLLKVILLFYIFTPKELKGEFLGFIKKFYHDTKNITQDTKDQEKELEAVSQETPLKLKILEKNMKKLTIFNYSIASNIKYDIQNKSFYHEGNRFGRIYKKLNISHDQDQFDSSLLSPLIRYYMNLYKLISDFEIYLLLRFDETNELSVLKEDKRLFHNNHYNFTTLLSKTLSISPKEKKYHPLTKLRNNISHHTLQNLFIEFEKNTLLTQRENIVSLIQEQKDIKELLTYDPINDFTMKTIQLLKTLEVNSDKSQKIEEMLQNKEPTANDFYNIYKLKGVETIKKELFIRIGKREIEKQIEEKITKGTI